MTQQSETNRSLTSRMRSQPTVSFFILAFAITWTVWFAGPLLTGNDRAVTVAFQSIGAFGPALSAIFVASTIDPAPSDASVKRRRVVFAAVLAAAVLIEAVGILYSGGFSLEVLPILLASAVIAAYVVSCVYHPKRGVVRVMAGLRRVSALSVWVWVAVALPFAWQFLAAAIDLGFGGTELFSTTWGTLITLLVAYPSTFFFVGPVEEEAGWRGFATPRIQQRLTPLATGLMIGVIWTIWHFPLHLTIFYGDGLTGFLLRFTYNVPFGVIFTWFYNRSKGNLFAAMLLHTSVNCAGILFGQGSFFIEICVIAAFMFFVVFYDKMYRKTPNPLAQQRILSENERSSSPQS